MSRPRNRKKDWEDRRDVEAIIDYISKNFPDDKTLPKELEKATTLEDFQSVIALWVVNNRKHIEELAAMARKLPTQKT